MPSPAVAVVVPVRDDVRLVRCLAALARQTLPRSAYELVVVDDGSGRPAEAEQAVAATPGPVTLLRQRPAGSYAARNRGLAATDARLVAFTDADCLPEADWLERALHALGSSPAAAVAGRIEVFHPRRPTAVGLHDALTAFPQRHFVEAYGFGATANLVVRRTALDAVGPFDPTYLSGGDAEWGQRATRAGCRTVYAHDVVVRHPARDTVGAVVAKARRTAAGVARIAAADPPSLRRLAVLAVAQPVRQTRDALRAGGLAGPADAARFAAGSALHAGVVLAETLRVRLAARA